ncbi:MAG: ATP-binding protein [Gemmatimonadaceae bacterium]
MSNIQVTPDEFGTAHDPLFAGPGEMRARCRATDWRATSLGPVAAWPPSLRTIVATMLASRHPMFLWWGPDLIQIFNDAYRPSFGDDGRHVRALGARGSEFWTEIWGIIGPQIDQVMAGGPATWHEDQLVPILRNGTIEDVWWTYGYSPAFDDDGNVGGVLVVCQETTARVRAAAELQVVNKKLEVERSRLEYAFQQAPAFLAVLRGAPLAFEFVNEAFYRLVGRRELVGKVLLDAIPEARGQDFEELLNNVVETGEPFVGKEMPLAVQRTAGSGPEERLLDFVYFPLVEADGSRSGVICHGVDVTGHVTHRRESDRARKEAEAARERTARLQALTSSLSTSATVDEIGRAIVAGAESLLGAVGIVVARVTHGGDELEIVSENDMPGDIRDQWRRFPITAHAPLAHAARTGEALFIESREDFAARYPELVDLQIATGHHANIVIPLIVDDRTLGVIGAAFDDPRTFDNDDRAAALNLARQCAQALDRARLFEAERDARSNAEAANRAKGEFLAVMSHELRTPLNAIDGYAELMELGIRGPLTELQRDDLGRIRKSQRHLLGLINGVLNYARAEAGAVRYDVADVSVDDVLVTCEALVALQVNAKGIQFDIVEREPGLTVRADGEKLQQILLNLLTNSLKFTDRDGHLSLGCTATATQVNFAVSDTGRGIAANQLARVFEPFVQIDARLTRTQEGVGLGLAISRDLARGMGGDITAVSTIGVGSTFTLSLPRGETN